MQDNSGRTALDYQKDKQEQYKNKISKGGKRGTECELDISETQQEYAESNIRRKR